MSSNIIKSEQNVIKYIESAFELTDKLFAIDIRSLQILHLDDHTLYSRGLEKCIKEKFPNVIIKNIANGNDALEYVTFAFENNIIIDLIITDVMHTGLDGIKFCIAVKELENKFYKSIPIMFLTMCDYENFREQVECLPMVKFISKATLCEEIKLTIGNLT